MQTKRIWDNNTNNTFYKTIEEVIEAIKDEKINMSFTLKDKFTPGDNVESIYDDFANRENIILNYTDEQHPVMVSNVETYFYPPFYKKYEQEIKNAYVEQIKKSDELVFYVYKNVFSDALLNEILKIDDVSIYLYDIELTDEQLQKIQSKSINCYNKKNGVLKKISSKYVFGLYTKERLQTESIFTFTIKELKNIDINNFIYCKDNATIIINSLSSINKTTEENELIFIKDLLLQIDSLNKPFQIKLEIDKRSVFNKIFQDIIFNNINFVIQNDYYDYSYEEYLKEEEKLNNLIKDIKDQPLSPFEKYLFVYNIVKNYKEYKENENDRDRARRLRYIIDNEYMVCVGYAKLLATLLDKVGINTTELSVDVDTSYDEGFTVEEKITNFEGHKRVLVSIDDDKYNIHGLFVADPTWDNDLENNFLNNALMTFDKMQVDRRLFKYSISQPVLDIHNFNEYNNQVNFLLKRKIYNHLKDPFFKDKTYSYTLLFSYKEVGKLILKTIRCDPKYQELDSLLDNCRDENNYMDFFTKLGNYLLTRTNIPIDEKLFFKAQKEILIKTQKSNIENIMAATEKDYYDRDSKQFPYEVASDNEHDLIDKKI